jgi:hypothetical protein
MIAAGKLKDNKLTQGIPSNSWLMVIVDGKLKGDKLDTQKSE